ncbi:hypothetical protein [Vibrio jasicida]|jgi:hypothetical protein|uniref:hypothetical protein n=1 Tax=Vibrio jasicida TaxID=766224 RepID=UPI000CE4C1FF|nr:hypothetical protein [Vibrio jasicida]
MDKNTFWSHTAPSYELIPDSEFPCSEEQQCRTKKQDNWVKCQVVQSTTYLVFEGTDDDEVIEVREFKTSTANTQSSKDKESRWFAWSSRK